MVPKIHLGVNKWHNILTLSVPEINHFQSYCENYRNNSILEVFRTCTNASLTQNPEAKLTTTKSSLSLTGSVVFVLELLCLMN